MRLSGKQISLGPLIAIGALAATLGVGTFTGFSARRLPPSRPELQAPDVVAAADMLRASGAHAGTLVLLDSSSHNKRDIELAKIMHSAPSSSYVGLGVSGDAAVSALIHSGVAREVWVVIPDAEWPDVVAGSATLPQNIGSATMPTRRFDGALVHYTSLKDLPIAQEPILLLANAAELNGYDAQRLGRLRDPAVSRVAVTFGSGDSK